jgi:hypothetical protein
MGEVTCVPTLEKIDYLYETLDVQDFYNLDNRKIQN